jgi:hypothetical protein
MNLYRHMGQQQSFVFPSCRGSDDTLSLEPIDSPGLNDDDRKILAKLIGVLTKKGRKSKARKTVLEAMHIIKQQLKQGTAAGASTSKS